MASKSFKDIYSGIISSADREKNTDVRSQMADNKLDLDELSSVSGGVITSWQEFLLRMAVSSAKNEYGCTKDEVLNGIPEYYDMYSSQYPNVTMDDVTSWIEKNWDKI